MKVGVPRENEPGETRAALVPADASRLTKLGVEVEIEPSLGEASGHSDTDYVTAGASLARSRRSLFEMADVVLRLHPPSLLEVGLLRPGSVHISLLNPFAEPELVAALAARGVSALSLELIPRIARAQGMDVLTSQASIAGYVAVVLAAQHLHKILPMMTTAAGTIAPARVLVLGAGVAGLQAIATAKRLGAAVYAFDVRSEVEEQVRSVGARFIRIPASQARKSEQGYAVALGQAQLEHLRQALRPHCASADIVITAAQVFGRRAPALVARETLDAMRPGSVVVDLAVEMGGNVEGIPANAITQRQGVTIIAWQNLPARAPVTASQMLSGNLTALVCEFWDQDARRFDLKLDDEIIKGCLVMPPARFATQDSKFNEKCAKNDFGCWRPGRTSLAAALFLTTSSWAGVSALAAESSKTSAPELQARPPSPDFISAVFVFMLAAFVGLQVIRRVSRLLHTPLMSLTNAISAIAVVGAILVAGPEHPPVIRLLGLMAVAASVANIVSGFLITDRMLKMFRKSGERKSK
jgi:NAD(P) transhydrogenase subunit alpha